MRLTVLATSLMLIASATPSPVRAAGRQAGPIKPHVAEAEAIRVQNLRADLQARNALALTAALLSGVLLAGGTATAIVGAVGSNGIGFGCHECGTRSGGDDVGEILGAVGGAAAGVGLIGLLITVPIILSSQKALNHLPLTPAEPAASSIRLSNAAVAASANGATARLTFAF